MARRISSIFVSLALEPSDFRKNLKSLSRELSRAQRQLSSIGRGLTTGLTAPLAAAGVAAFKFSADFDDALTKSTAIMGDLSDAMRTDLSNAARQVAKESRFSAQQAAESFFFLASAGLDARQSIAALPQVVRFATAGNFDLSRATDLATDAQSALGLTVKDAAKNLSNLTRVTDVLIKANTLANASAEQFSESLTNQAGAALRQVNKDIEEGVAVLAVYADQGVKGAEAGTKLFQVLRDLQKAALESSDSFDALGIEVFDSDGEFRNLADVVEDFEKALSGLSTEQKRTALSTLGLQEKSIGALLALIGTSDAIRRYEGDLRSAAGTTQEVADKQLKSISARFDLIKSQAADVAIELGQSLAPGFERLFALIKSGIGTFDRWVKAFGTLSPEVRETVVLVGSFLALLGPLALALGVVIGAVNALGASLSLATAGISTVIAATVLLIANWEELGTLTQQVWIAIKDLFASVVESLLEGLASLSQAIPFVGDALDELVTRVRRWRDSLQEDFDQVFQDSRKTGDAIEEAAQKADQALQSAQPAVDAIAAKFQSLALASSAAAEGVEDVAETVRQLQGGFADPFPDLGERLRQLGDLRSLGVIDEFQLLQGQISATEEALNSLVEQNLTLTDPALQMLAGDVALFREQLAGLVEQNDAFLEQSALFAEGMNSVLGSVSDVGRGLGNSLGDALVHGESFSKSLSKSMKNLAADFISSLIQMGIRLAAFTLLSIALGKKEALSKAFSNSATVFGNVFKSVTETVPFPLNVILAPIIAGAAAAAVLVGATAFAKGGIVFGPTLGLVGEAGTEVIMPLDRLNEFLPSDDRRSTFNLIMDGRQVARSTVPHLPGILDVHLGSSRGF